MTAIQSPIRNGVDTGRMFATLDLIKDQPELAKFRFRVANRWVAGAHNRSTIKGFYAAGGEDTTRAAEFQLDAGEPAILLGADEGPNPAEYLLHALAACLTTSIVYVAAARKVELTSVESALTGDMDVRGALGVDDEPRNGFERIAVEFRVAGNAPAEKLREVVERARQRSAVYDMVTNGVPVALEVSARLMELQAHTEAGARLVALAEELAEGLAANAASHDRDGTYPFEAIDALKAAGYFAAPVPVELGGLGVDSAHDLVVASSRLARGDASVAIGVNMHLVAVLNMERRRQRGGGRRRGAPRGRVRRVAGADRARRRRARRRHQRARPGPHPPRHARRAHGDRLADRRPQDVLHDVAGRDRTSTSR